MELVVDATILFTGLIGTGVTKDVIFSEAVKLYAPEYLLDEFERHKPRIKILSGLSSAEVELVLDKIKKRIKVVSKEKFDKYLLKANSLISDKEDIEYLALSISLNKMPIWSNDPHFKKQKEVKALTTEELVSKLKSLGYRFPD